MYIILKQYIIIIASTISTNVVEKPNKLKALEDLDVLGETLLKQSLPTSCKVGSQFTK